MINTSKLLLDGERVKKQGGGEGVEMKSMKSVVILSQIICIIIVFLHLNKFDLFLGKNACLRLYSPSSVQVQEMEDGLRATEEQFYTSLLSRLVKGEIQTKLYNSGFACESKFSTVSSCVTTIPLSIDSRTDQVHLRCLNYSARAEIIKVWPYTWPGGPLETTTPLNIYTTTTTIAPPPLCTYNHHVPVIIFSVGGHPGNRFHEFNEIIIPLFVTSRLFQSQVQFMISDYRSSVVEKYNRIILGLTNYPIINIAEITNVHCFPGAIIGLKFHTFLGLNSSDAPLGYSMLDFKAFLREIYTLRARNVVQIVNIGKPVLILIGREVSRKLVNEDEMVKMMEELGYKVIVARAKQMANLNAFSKILGSCSVLVGVHGAGLTNQVFLPDGALVVQLVPLGLDWASRVYFGDSAERMGLRYLEYKIDPEESTLFDMYGPDDPVIKDPDSVFAEGFDIGREIYIIEQNIKVNIDRFKESFIKALNRSGLST